MQLNAKNLVFVSIVAAALSMGCKKDAETKPAEATPAVEAEKPAEKADPAAEKPAAGAKEEPKAAEKVEKVPAEAFEIDPSARGDVKVVDFKGKAPDDIEIKGEHVTSFGWDDKYGKNAIVITKEKLAKNGAKLVASFYLWEGDSWTLQREMKEAVDSCDGDLEVTPLTGDWSVTDLDKNKLGEGTFAYRAGCRTDVSPITFKVLMVQNGPNDKPDKYALRGTTRVFPSQDSSIGGEYKADPAFDKAPKAFLEHAIKVWNATHIEQ